MKSIIFICVLAVGLLFSACYKIPSDFELPKSWDVDVYLPIIDVDYSILELLDEAESMSIDSSLKAGEFAIILDTFWRKTSVTSIIGDLVKLDETQITIPPVNGEQELYLPFKHGTSMDTAYFSNGDLNVTVQNNSTGKMEFEISFPGTRTANNKNLIIATSIAAGKTFNKTYSLQNIAYSSREYPEKSNSIKVQMKVEYEQAAGQSYVSLSLNNTKARYAEGILRQSEPKFLNESLAITIDSNILEYNKNIRFLKPTLQLSASYKAEHNQFYDVLLSENQFMGMKNNNSQSIMITAPDGSGVIDEMFIDNGNYEMLLTSENSNIVDFIDFYPDSLALRSVAYINPNEEFGIIDEKDTVIVMAVLRLGNSIRVQNLDYRDTIDLDIPYDIRTELKNANSVLFTFEFVNTMQVAADATIAFMDKDYQALFSKDMKIDASESPNPSQAQITIAEIPLDSIEIQQFAEVYFARISLLVNTTGADESMVFHVKDKIKIKTKFQVNYNVDTE